MRKDILKDKMLKLIIEDIYVTRAQQVGEKLNLDDGIVLPLLKEMEESDHIKLVKVGSKQTDVIILKAPGRQFYKSSSYTQLGNGAEEIPDRKPSGTTAKGKTLTWIIVVLIVVALLIVGFMQGWFS
jgi:hypothetical protein